MVPVREFWSTKSCCSLTRVESWAGMLPLALLVPRLSSVRAVREDSCWGIDEVRRLPPKLRKPSPPREDMVVGIEPLMWLLLRSRYVSAVRFPTAESSGLLRPRLLRSTLETRLLVQVMPFQGTEVSQGLLVVGQGRLFGKPQVVYMASRELRSSA